MRNDLEKARSNWLAMLVTTPHGLIRLFVCFPPWMVMVTIAWFLSLFKGKHTMVKGKIYCVLRFMQMAVARWDLFLAGCWPGMLEEKHLDIDYRKYLGPNWKPNKNLKPTAVISNHQTWFDILVHMYFQMPSHVAKEGTKNIPAVGACSVLYGCLFVKRDNKDSKQNMFTQIAER